MFSGFWLCKHSLWLWIYRGSRYANRAYSRDWGNECIFWSTFVKKRGFCWLAPPKQMLFLTTSNQNIFLKTQGTRLGVIVAPNKGLEWALTGVTQSSEYAWISGSGFESSYSGSGFESSYSHFTFRFRACFEQEVPWHSGNCWVRIHSQTHTWHDKNIQSPL